MNLILFFSYFLVLAVTASIARAPDTNIQELLLPLTRSNGYFAATLYNAVRGNSENILISPLSINYALTGLTLGAAGYTLKELKIVLNQPEHESLIVSSYGLFAAMLKFDKNLTVATKLYADTLFPLNKSYQAEMKYFFLADVDNANFSGDPERARHIINEYVDHNTDHLIRELLSKGSINKATPSIIVNAVHFESEWEHPFERTDNKPFHGFHKIFHVEMMHHSQMVLNYVQDNVLKAQLLELPYTGGYTFLVILPNDKNGLSEVERKLISRANNPNASPFIDIFKQTKPVTIDVSLPKFKFEQTNNLRNALKKMGLKLIFTSSANFQKISNQPLFIGDIAQKTFISVNEKGTEAAAATAIFLRTMSLSVPSPPTFNADHPFIYIVKHELSETPLFIGRYAHP